MRTLAIGNKTYSSWSLRPWLLMRHFGVPFEEKVIPLDTPESKANMLKVSPAGRVPVLIDGETTVWETIAIMEYVGDALGAQVWPQEQRQRALARSLAAEMHAGFSGLRSACPMNLGKQFGPRDRGAAAARDAERFGEIVRDTRGRYGADGPFLFGAFSAADAMYAPLATRLDTYSIPMDAVTRAYVDAILALPAFRQWLKAALDEPWVVEADEVDEVPIAVFRSNISRA